MSYRRHGVVMGASVPMPSTLSGGQRGESHAASAVPTATASNASAHERHMVREYSAGVVHAPRG